MNIPIETSVLSEIISRFEVRTPQGAPTDFADTSWGEDDVRWNFIYENSFVLKINSASCMSGERLFEICASYRAITP